MADKYAWNHYICVRCGAKRFVSDINNPKCIVCGQRMESREYRRKENTRKGYDQIDAVQGKTNG